VLKRMHFCGSESRLTKGYLCLSLPRSGIGCQVQYFSPRVVRICPGWDLYKRDKREKRVATVGRDALDCLLSYDDRQIATNTPK
jgi:hypothetical protein